MEHIFLAGLLVMILTSIGSLIAVLFKKMPDWSFYAGLAFSGGVMLVASFTSLILPAVERGNIFVVMLGIVLGFFVIFVLEKFIPHEEYFIKFKKRDINSNEIKGIFLIVSAIVIHNIPEGMAVGTAMANDIDKGWATAVAIGLQDIPEGLAVSLPLIFLTERIWIPVVVGILSGFSEFLFTVFGGFVFSSFTLLLPLGLSLAGGAMIYVTVKEVFPQIYKKDGQNFITIGFLVGLLLMLYLDVMLG